MGLLRCGRVLQMTGRLPLHPGHPERVCWGCSNYCAADDMRCGNGSIRTPHPVELFGDDWLESATDGAQASDCDPSALVTAQEPG